MIVSLQFLNQRRAEQTNAAGDVETREMGYVHDAAIARRSCKHVPAE